MTAHVKLVATYSVVAALCFSCLCGCRCSGNGGNEREIADEETGGRNGELGLARSGLATETDYGRTEVGLRTNKDSKTATGGCASKNSSPV